MPGHGILISTDNHVCLTMAYLSAQTIIYSRSWCIYLHRHSCMPGHGILISTDNHVCLAMAYLFAQTIMYAWPWHTYLHRKSSTLGHGKLICTDNQAYLAMVYLSAQTIMYAWPWCTYLHRQPYMPCTYLRRQSCMPGHGALMCTDNHVCPAMVYLSVQTKHLQTLLGDDSAVPLTGLQQFLLL